VTGTGRSYDTVVVGAGLGGLLAAAVAARSGKSVLLVERLPYLGGRFTTVEQDGYPITTGALHLVPYGAGGALAELLWDVGVGFVGVRRDAIGSFFERGRHYVWRRPHEIFRLFGPRAKLDFLTIAAQLTVRRFSNADDNFGRWLARQTTDRTVIRVFERSVEFSLSLQTQEVACAEVQAILHCILRYGLPTAPRGGCKAVVDQLAAFLTAHRGDQRTFCEVVEIRLAGQPGKRHEVVVRDRRTQAEETIQTDLVISDAGPRSTAALLKRAEELAPLLPSDQPVARGLKLHLVSDVSLIPHNGIMLCLDTQRIAGIVQVSNAVPSLTADGRHLLDTFQVMQSDDVARERRLAVEDLRYIFGSDFDRSCRIVRASAFHRAWPVNRIRQGQDVYPQTPLPGLVMVGDAYKPAGYMMVEGVAASVKNVRSLLV
jgi:phytoene dehydrogenase-like protein